MKSLASMNRHQVTGIVLLVYFLIAVFFYLGLIALSRTAGRRYDYGDAGFIILLAFLWPASIILFIGISFVEITYKLIER